MHITAHPDDEQGGVLAALSRRDGVRLALLTLTRGEAGDNAIGPQLFDALGLIRTEELLAANRYYGVDEQYFTTAVDYGFSKRLDEALDKWGRDNVLRDVVRIIRTSRPWILLSRFQGSARDGHGNHQAAGVIALEAFKAAGDPSRFPEQIALGLRPWQPFKIYIGGVRDTEEWTVRIDGGEYSPWLGDSYDSFARRGLGFQRSQNGGRVASAAGPSLSYFRRVGSRVAAPARENGFFDGLPAANATAAIDAAVARAIGAFSIADPSASVPALVDGLRLTRGALTGPGADPEILFTLLIKERQFQDAINAALGLQLTAMPQPETMPAPVDGQAFEVHVRLANRGRLPITPRSIELQSEPGWQVTPSAEPTVGDLAGHAEFSRRFGVVVTPGAALSTRPYFARAGLDESRYTLRDAAQFGRPDSAPPLAAAFLYTIDGVTVEMREAVRRREPKPPYGDAIRELRNVPVLAVAILPSHAIVPMAGPAQRIDVEVSLLHNAERTTNGDLRLTLPPGWTAAPAAQAFTFSRAGERTSYRFRVTPGMVAAETYRIDAVATTGGREYREGYELIDHRDLELRYLYRAAVTHVRGIDLSTVQGLKVGYVMGVGDQVPEALRQLGAEVALLGDRELASANLSVYDAIVTGTRAYAVREDLKTYNQRLLDYVRDGGNMIVLYNTQEFAPASFAPFPGQLPRTAEEVSEEDSPVEILAPAHQAFMWPNRITRADFDGWVEQRGSKFFTEWDAAYTPMIATFDKGQAPQRGGWLTARYGKGTWTYFAYALHRQLPYGVPGAYRIAANLLALGRPPQQ
jgi:LmbE family N-acetylglucosaminyl deacetylase